MSATNNKRKTVEEVIEAPRAKKQKGPPFFKVVGSKKEPGQTTQDWLTQLTVARGDAPIIVLGANDSILSALKVLCSEDVQSAPVREKDRIIGVIDLFDVVHHMTDYLKDIENMDPEALSSMHIDPKEILSLKAKVKDVMGCSDRQPFESIKHGDDLAKVVSMLGDMKMHRVYMIDEASYEPEGVVSQSAFLQWMNMHLDELNDHMKQTIEELGIVNEGDSVITMTESEPAIQAFRLMVKHNVSAIGVVNERKQLTNVISARDVKVVLSEKGLNVPILFSDVLTYISAARQSSLDEKSPRITVSASATLEKTVRLLAATRIHRVFVVDKNGKPVGVVALRDIIRQLMA